MLRQKNKLLICLFFVSSTAMAVTNSHTEEQKLLEELTGKSTRAVVAPKVVTAAAPSLSQQHLQAGLKAASQKSYAIAIKYFNTVIINYKSSPEVPEAYRAKAELYEQMGLPEQAQLNFKLAKESQTQIK